MADTVTPNDMPGAQDDVQPGAVTEVKTGKTEAEPAELSGDDKAELARLREVHKDEQKWRRQATTDHADAEAHRNLLKAMGVDGKAAKDFDAQAAIADLNSKFEKAETARIRSEVARTEGVDPEDFTGDTEDEMRASAQRFKAKIAAGVDAALKARGPSAAPATEVSANGKVDGPKQIRSRDELKNMTPKQVLEAQKNGLLDDLMSGKT